MPYIAFLIFQIFFDCDFIIHTYFTHIAVSGIATDDVTDQVMHSIAYFTLTYDILVLLLHSN